MFPMYVALKAVQAIRRLVHLTSSKFTSYILINSSLLVSHKTIHQPISLISANNFRTSALRGREPAHV